MASFDLVRIPRLSVMPVTQQQWEILMKMAGD
jgi:predicted RNA-binding protein with PUA-like domain